MGNMKTTDIEKIHDAGLITEEQRQKIVEHFQLKEDGGGNFLAIVSIIGAVLIAAGITLLIAAHWNDIPRGVKIAAGLVLMLGFHAGGWWLSTLRSSPATEDGREVQGKYRKTGEALHLIGSCLFLANIALIGQIYNIVSRPPNTFLLWWIGIAALPWLLRSAAQFALLLLALKDPHASRQQRKDQHDAACRPDHLSQQHHVTCLSCRSIALRSRRWARSSVPSSRGRLALEQAARRSSAA